MISEFFLNYHIPILVITLILVTTAKYYLQIKRNRSSLSSRTITADMQRVEMAKKYGVNYWLHLHNNGNLKHYTDEN